MLKIWWWRLRKLVVDGCGLSVEGGGWSTTGYWWLVRATLVDVWWLQEVVEGGWLMVVDGSGIVVMVVMGFTMVDW
ncbi:hypothetical protein Hanom_Chr08g00701441 [Helianthus anomalus]